MLFSQTVVLHFVHFEYKQEVQGLQAFAFPVEIVNDEHVNQDSKENLGVKFKESVCIKLCLKL